MGLEIQTLKGPFGSLDLDKGKMPARVLHGMPTQHAKALVRHTAFVCSSIQSQFLFQRGQL